MGKNQGVKNQGVTAQFKTVIFFNEAIINTAM
jgi:hypothetical protein